MNKKIIRDVKLERDNQRIFITVGKSKYYTSLYSRFPINELVDRVAMEVSVVNSVIKSIKMSSTEIYKDSQNQNRQVGQEQPGRDVIGANEAGLGANNQPQYPDITVRGSAARAPYNFVPLNATVIPSNGEVDHSKYSGHSGYIELGAEAKSPVFIRGSDGNFFKVNDKFYLPGSSIRGMVRQLTEVISYGNLDFFTNRYLYRRSTPIADVEDVHAGFLIKDNNGYKIHEAMVEQLSNQNIRIAAYDYQYVQNTSCTFATGNFNGRVIIWKFTKVESDVHLNTGLDSVLDSYRADDTRGANVIDLLKSINKGQIVKNDGKSTIRNRNIDVPTNLGIPVFYRKNNNNRIITIGHAKYHRLPYKKQIKDHIIQSGDAADFTKVLFGSDAQAGKVYFEDLAQLDTIRLDLEKALKPKILSSPKPTSYQLYLQQNSQTNKNWSDENTPIRGWKYYWHKQTSSKRNDPNTWIETGQPGEVNPDAINPVSIGSKFAGRIRFEGLNDVELGLLLMALDLPEGCAHKLGMAKPLGLGSMRFSANLTLIDRSSRYEQVFDEQGQWCTGQKRCSEAEKDHFKNTFVQYMSEKLANPSLQTKDCYWEKDARMVELKSMLTLEHAPYGRVAWNNRTRYMKIDTDKNDYRRRFVLPSPTRVAREDLYEHD